MPDAAGPKVRPGSCISFSSVRAVEQRLRRDDPAAAAVIDLVAGARGQSFAALLHRTRGRAETAAARQLAMYLMHVKLGRTLTQVGAVFRRDRTTVAHACALIEDRRDEAGFEGEVSRLEDAIDCLFSTADEAPEGHHAVA